MVYFCFHDMVFLLQIHEQIRSVTYCILMSKNVQDSLPIQISIHFIWYLECLFEFCRRSNEPSNEG